MAIYVPYSAAGVRWWSDPEFLPTLRVGPFADLERALREARLVKDLRMKRTVEIDHAGRTYLVKTYKPGSLARRAWSWIAGTRARRELESCERVRALRVPAVPLLAAAEWSGGSCVVVEKLSGWVSLEDHLRGRSDPELVRRYGDFARRLQEVGIYQEDFNPSNILFRDGEFRLIDYERLTVRPALTEDERLHLIAKLLRLDTIGPGGLNVFLSGYLRPGESLDAVRATILRHWARIREQDLRRARAHCLRENRNFGRLATERHLIFYRKGAIGLTETQALGLEASTDGFRALRVDDALDAWKTANADWVDRAGPLPVAALVEKGRARGMVVYRPAP